MAQNLCECTQTVNCKLCEYQGSVYQVNLSVTKAIYV